MLLLDGCVQPTLAPGINAATARVLDRLGISLVRAPKAQCCGALPFHLDAQDQGVQHAKRNIDAWWPYVEQGIEAIVITASGCGVMVKQYDRLLQHYPEYAEKSKRVSSLAQDVSHIIAAEREKLTQILASSKPETENQTLAFHSPCTLQHGLKTRGVVENVLRHCGFELCQVKDEHLCCGSAGTYSILQPEMSQTLLKNKIKSLHAGSPQIIATANIGCLIQLRKGTQKPVHHWIEILDNKLQNRITEN